MTSVVKIWLVYYTVLQPSRPSLFPYTTLFRSWIKNLTRVRFGRMGKRFEQRKDAKMLHALQDLTGKKIDPQLFEERSEEHTSELQSRGHLVCRLLLVKKK